MRSCASCTHTFCPYSYCGRDAYKCSLRVHVVQMAQVVHTRMFYIAYFPYSYMWFLRVHVVTTGKCEPTYTMSLQNIIVLYTFMRSMRVHVVVMRTHSLRAEMFPTYLCSQRIHVFSTRTCVICAYMCPLAVHVSSTRTCGPYAYMCLLRVHVFYTRTHALYAYIRFLRVKMFPTRVSSTFTCVLHAYMRFRRADVILSLWPRRNTKSDWSGVVPPGVSWLSLTCHSPLTGNLRSDQVIQPSWLAKYAGRENVSWKRNYFQRPPRDFNHPISYCDSK